MTPAAQDLLSRAFPVGDAPPGVKPDPADRPADDALADLCLHAGEAFAWADDNWPGFVGDLAAEPSQAFPGAIDWQLDFKLRGVARGASDPLHVDESAIRALENLVHALRRQRNELTRVARERE